MNSFVTSLDNELLGASWTQDNLPYGGILHEFKFFMSKIDWCVGCFALVASTHQGNVARASP